MLILGLLLLAGTAVFTGIVIGDNRTGLPDHNVTVFGQHIATMNSLEIFCAGIALALIFAFGLLLVAAGSAHHRRRTLKIRAARKDAAQAARERDELAARLNAGDPYATTGEPYASDAAPTVAEPAPYTADYSAEPNRTPDTDSVPEPARASEPSTGSTRAVTVPERSHRRHARHLFGH
jgi:hypothetical protein